MSVARWNPMREIEEILNRYQGLPGDAWARSFGNEDIGTTDWRPAVDIRETPEAYQIEIDLPAVDPNDVDVNVSEGVLTVQGERRPRGEAEGERIHRTERRYGRFARSFVLPETADPERISAQARNGVLQLTVGKKESHRPRNIEIEVG